MSSFRELFKISVAHPYSDIQVAVSYIVLMLRTKIWAGDPDLGVITIQIDQKLLMWKRSPRITVKSERRK